MQTDPNWANFLYNPSADRLGLIDFGASREYTPEFMDAWHGLLTAALEGDREGMREQSLRIGYFTGEEEEVRLFHVAVHLAISYRRAFHPPIRVRGIPQLTVLGYGQRPPFQHVPPRRPLCA